MPRIALAVGAVTIAFVAVACGDSGNGGTDTTAPRAGAEGAVTIRSFSFNVDGTVSVGSTVVVTNNDGVAHTWTADDGTFDSGAMSPNGTFEFGFTEPGEYSFHCAIHPTMTGTITVTG